VPLSAFHCPRCGHEYDRLLSLNADQSALRCLDFGSPVKRVGTTFATAGSCHSDALLAQGTGWSIRR
jgi:hypothetical protein